MVNFGVYIFKLDFRRCLFGFSFTFYFDSRPVGYFEVQLSERFFVKCFRLNGTRCNGGGERDSSVRRDLPFLHKRAGLGCAVKRVPI